jgi:hypothetical protein
MTVPAPQTAVLTEKPAVLTYERNKTIKFIGGTFAITVVTISALAAWAINRNDSAIFREYGYITFLGALMIAGSIFLSALLLTLRQAPIVVLASAREDEPSAHEDEA